MLYNLKCAALHSVKQNVTIIYRIMQTKLINMRTASYLKPIATKTKRTSTMTGNILKRIYLKTDANPCDPFAII